MKTNKFFTALMMVFLMCVESIRQLYQLHKFKKLLKLNEQYSDLTAIGFQEAIASGILDSTERVNIDVRDPLYSNMPKTGSLYTILDKFKRSDAKTTLWKGFEQRESDNTTTNSGTFSPSATAGAEVTITLPSTGVVKQMYVNRTIKLHLNIDTANGFSGFGKITEVLAGTNQIKVKPINPAKKFGKNASVVADASPILMLGNVNEENAEAKVQPSVLPSPISNVTQTIRNNFKLSLEAGKQRMYGVNEIMRNAKSKQYDHLRDIVRTTIWNGEQYQLNQSQTEDTQLNYTEGIETTIYNNSDKNLEYDDPNDVYDAFEEFQYNLFDTNNEGGEDARFMIANRAMRKFVTQMKKDRGWYILNNDVYKEVFGISGVKTVITDQGEFHMFYDNIASQFNPAIDKPYGLALHLKYIELGDFHKTEYRTNIQNRNVLSRWDEWVTILTSLVYLPEMHGLFRHELG